MTDTERTHQPPQEAPQPLISRALTARSVLSFIFALAILTFFVTRLEINIDGIRSTIAETDFWLYALAFLVYYCTFPLRGLRWQTILQNVGFSRKSGIHMPHLLGLSEIIYLGWFANCIIPVKLGDAYRGYQLKHGTGVSFSTTMGTILAERFIDMGVVVFLMLATSLLLATTGDSTSGIAGLIFSGGLALLLIGTGGLGAMRMFRGQLHNVLPQRLQAFYLRFQEGTLGSFQRLPLVVGITLVVWLGESSRLFLVSNALRPGAELSLRHLSGVGRLATYYYSLHARRPWAGGSWIGGAADPSRRGEGSGGGHGPAGPEHHLLEHCRAGAAALLVPPPRVAMRIGDRLHGSRRASGRHWPLHPRSNERHGPATPSAGTCAAGPKGGAETGLGPAGERG